jgi:acetylornithine deacetylase/succinyl-diaminopimelate desuccinylase-like protein
MIKEALTLTEKEKEKQLQQLIEFVSIPSISTLPEHKPDIATAAQWLSAHLQAIGLQNVKIFPTELHPVVYAEWLGAPGQPTVLIYGHYDVQPVDPLDLWKSHPFKPEVREHFLYARGASDDKGQTFAHIKAVEAYLKTAKKLPVNVKFLIEGEEEIGSPSLTNFVASNKALLKADVSLISDSHILSPTQPSIVYGLRGLAYLELEVNGPDHDLHSGSYGGGVHNPLNALAAIIAKLHHADGSIAVTGFYDRVRALSADERKELAKLPFDEKAFCQEAGISAIWGEQAYTPIERLGARPTLDVNGIWGGFIGVGAKTVLPATATAKISMRLVPDQDPQEIAKLFQAYVEKIAPKTVKATVRSLGHFAQPAIVDRHIPEMQAAVKAYKEGFGAEPLFTREGGSIPVVTLLKKQLGIDSILMGFGLPDDRLHSPNERFFLPNFYKGIQTSLHFMNFLKK